MGREFDQGLEVWGGVMPVCVVSLGYLCRWQVQVSVYCARRIPVHLSCLRCSIMSLLIDICFIPCICYGRYRKSRHVCVLLSDLDWSRHHPPLWGAVSAIQRVHMAGLPKKGKSGTHCWGGRFRHNLHCSLPKPL